MRYKSIDTIRGITIVSMILYHLTWDLYYLFDIPLSFIHSHYVYIWQQSICCSFIFISGFCWNFSRRPLYHGLQTIFFGSVITGITVFFLPEEQILFGVLFFLGSAMLFTCFFDVFLKKVHPYIGIISSFLLFILSKEVMDHVFGLFRWKVKIPDSFYRNLFTTYLGFPMKGFYSTDYFGIIPWIFLFLTGYYCYHFFDRYFIKKEKVPALIQNFNLPCFSFLGRHSMVIYLIHQPVLYGIYLLWTIFNT